MKLAEILSGPETWYSPHTKLVMGTPERQCLFNAVSVLMGESFPKQEYERLSRIIGVRDYIYGWNWNDAPGRTWDEVSAIVEAYDRDKMLNP